MPNTLKNKAIKGVFWSMSEKFGGYIIQFITGIILARILSPHDFGLIGMVTFFFAIANVIIDGGLGNAFVQKKDPTSTDKNTIFFLNLSIAIILYTIFWFLAPLIAKFYNQPELVKLTRFMMIVLIINSLGLVQLSILQKSIHFKQNSIFFLISAVTSGIIGIILAIRGSSYWSLAIQMLLNRLIYVSILWFHSKWKPQLEFSITAAKELFSYGGWLLLSSIVTHTFSNVYQLIIGKFYNPSMLGYYSNAKKYVNIASYQINGAIGSVAFPVLAQMQDNPERMQNGIHRFIKSSSLMSFPVFIILFIISEPFITIVLGKQWLPMLPYFRLFCIIALFSPITNINSKALVAAGNSRLTFHISLVMGCLRILNIIIFSKKSIQDMLYGEIAISNIQALIFMMYSKRKFNYGILSQIRDIRIEILAATLSFSTGSLIMLNNKNLINQGIFGLLGSGGVYIITIYIFNRKVVNNRIKNWIITLRKN